MKGLKMAEAARSESLQLIDARENSVEELKKMRDDAWEENKQLKKQIIRENRAIEDFERLQQQVREMEEELFNLRVSNKTQKFEIQMLKFKAKLLKASKES